ncbi:class I SAM-dependent methyltransferase [Intestinimonas butyriciproducens]|uniref:class I SAM-dependent methyltransferase n=1 Tax=Intestinimonas butyriciproducens TaxID=1297617 RepID=UPI001959354B|nr:class I SAM-dependent methyltransferase [Intestinimonas butyriciproducens]MBM6917999.1 class I SAM-dependent methyltransferase [Intestinimonas butyriciproducens]
MSKLGVVEDTLFVPMLGRIYASEHCPQVLYDEKTLELKKKLPSGLLGKSGQSQYTLLASAARSANMDRFIRAFLERRPDGVIVQLGCGLETAYYRCDNGRSRWYAVDLPHVVEYRRALLPEPERETYLAGDAFAEDWIRQIRTDAPDAPILVTAGGLFHYFEESKVVGLLRMLTGFGEIEIVFDTVSKSGMAMMRKKYMKQVGHGDAQMFFYVDSASVLAGKIGSGVRVLAEEPYYRHIPRTGLKLSTKVSMAVSDRFCMVKMVHLCHSAKFHD